MEAPPPHDKQRIQMGLRCQCVLFALASDLSANKPWQGQHKFGNVFRQFAVIFLGYQNSWLLRTAVQPWVCAPASPLKACTTYREGRLTSFMVFQNIYHFGDAKVPKNWRSFCACPKKVKPEVALWNSVY